MPDSAEFDPTASLYKDASAAKQVAITGIVGVILTVATIALAVVVIVSLPSWSQLAMLLLAAAWGIGGPMWFFFEYFFIYRKSGAPNSWELFKHGQQLSGAVWVALTASLIVVGTSDLIKGPSEDYRCEVDLTGGTHATTAANRIHLVCTRR
jgi:hypothetical protein